MIRTIAKQLLSNTLSVLLVFATVPFDAGGQQAPAGQSAPAAQAPPGQGAPPLFIAVAADDQAVGYQGSLDLFAAWRKANIPVELHIFQTGAHGFVKKGGGADHYLERLDEWLKLNGWSSKPGP